MWTGDNNRTTVHAYAVYDRKAGNYMTPVNVVLSVGYACADDHATSGGPMSAY